MKNFLTWTLVAGSMAAQPLFAQPLFAQRGDTANPRSEPTNSLGRARAVFDAADADKDGKLNFGELQKQNPSIQKADFDAMDADKNGSWSRDEFLVYYRRLLLNANQRPAPDLESEVTRIQAARKAKAADPAPHRGAAPAPRSGTTPNDATPATNGAAAPTGVPAATAAATAATAATADVEARLQNAIDDLEKKAALRQATRADFDRVRDAMTARAKLYEAQDPVGAASTKAKFEDALVKLEVQAKQGNYSREEYNALREGLIKRGREAANGTGTPAAAAAGVPANETPLDIEARLQRALDELARKAEARQATREDFNRVRDAWSARAKAAMNPADPAAVAQQSSLAERFGHAMDELESQAASGNWSREKFDAMRESYIKRARAASGGAAVPEAGSPVAQADADAEKRFDEALSALETKALARGATHEDFQKVSDMLAQRARTAVKGPDGTSPADPNDPRIAALATKLHEALAGLEKSALAGTITREDFAALRQMYVNRARAAAGDKGPASGRGVTPPVKPVDPPKPAEPPKSDDATRGGREKPAPAPAPEPPKDDPKGEQPVRPPHASRG